VASKAGFIPYQVTATGDAGHYLYDHFIEPGIAEPDDFAGGIHCMAPAFLGQQIAWSLRNMGLRTLDIFYLQNPETQLALVDRRTSAASAACARTAGGRGQRGRIGCYGMATWQAYAWRPFRDNYMSLEVTRRS
jgi:aryl-alcohol dehydrogenase-like predicted oxidoreductase